MVEVVVVAVVVVGHPEDVVVVVVEQHFHPTPEMLVKTVAGLVAVVSVAQETVVQGTVGELAAAAVAAVPPGLEAVAGPSHAVAVVAVAGWRWGADRAVPGPGTAAGSGCHQAWPV